MDRSLLEAFGRRVRIGMVGGGADSVIGRTHLIAMRADGLCELTAGAMSIDPAIAAASGRQELLAPDRIYTEWRDMLAKESARHDRIDAVVVATPPRLHYPVAKAFLESGFNVICEKPLTHDLAEAHSLEEIVRKSGRLFCLTHCYTGYPMVRQARAMVAAGEGPGVMSTGATGEGGDGKMAAIDSVTFRARAVGGQATLNGWCSI
jgi:predicted dehydrogenase